MALKIQGVKNKEVPWASSQLQRDFGGSVKEIFDMMKKGEACEKYRSKLQIQSENSPNLSGVINLTRFYPIHYYTYHRTIY